MGKSKQPSALLRLQRLRLHTPSARLCLFVAQKGRCFHCGGMIDPAKMIADQSLTDEHMLPKRLRPPREQYHDEAKSVTGINGIFLADALSALDGLEAMIWFASPAIMVLDPKDDCVLQLVGAQRVS